MMDCNTIEPVWPDGFKPCRDVSAADWIAPRLRPWGGPLGTPVASIVPEGFDSYVRIFHPASGTAWGELLAWQVVADWSGRTFHPLAQFSSMATPVARVAELPPFLEPPAPGVLVPRVVESLVEVLAKRTDTPLSCHFAIWEGWGLLAGGHSRIVSISHDDKGPDTLPVDRETLEMDIAEFQRHVALLPRLRHLHRAYVMGRGPVDIACRLYDQPLGSDTGLTLGLTAQLWWPDDRAWVVASEIDLDSTVVAATTATAAALIESGGLEALLVPSNGRLDLGGDDVNGP